MSDIELQEVRDFWNGQSCGEVYASGESELERYENETRTRYELEPYIRDFARFEDFRDRDVLEIGVGMGSDHSSIARSGPRSLTGIDLTERAIEHTRKRFDLLGLKSNVFVDNAENLSFADESFDAVYSWGVLHHSPDTKKCFDEVWRVLRPGGEARIMIYYKYSPTALMLWARYGLLRMRPFLSLEDIHARYLESPGTKAYSVAEARKLTSRFSEPEFKVMLSFGDVLQGAAGQRHKGLMLTTAKAVYPRRLVRALGKVLPFGLMLLIRAKK